ncbi:MAG: hypothetical protein K2X87_28210 [Gemmataceae bacterium]|nr:hypothetical protein [Gemmataceae bacterium]
MDPHDPRRFVPRLEEIEGRLTPAANLTPEQVFGAAGLAELYFNGTRAALDNPAYFNLSTTRAPTQALAATIVAQAPTLADILNSYAVQLGNERAADPARADFLDPFIERYTTLAARATQSAAQAQVVSGRIDALNAADAARGRTAGGTSTGGTTTGGTTGTGTNGLGGLFPNGTTGTGTVGTGTTGTGIPGTGTTGTGAGTTGTGTATGGTSGTGTTTGGTSGIGTTTGTTGTTTGTTGTTTDTTATPGTPLTP